MDVSTEATESKSNTSTTTLTTSIVEVQPSHNGQNDREEGEIVDDFEDIISSDEEFNLRQRIEELEARNLELEKIAAISSHRSDYGVASGKPTFIDLVDDKDDDITILDNTVIIDDVDYHHSSAYRKSRKSTRRDKLKSTKHIRKKSKCRKHRYVRSTKRQYHRNSTKGPIDAYSSDEEEDFQLDREKLKAALKRDNRTTNESTSLKRKLEGVKQSVSQFIDSRSNEEIERDNFNVEILELLDDLTNDKGQKNDIEPVSDIENESISLEEQELRLIALKSAIVKKHEARKKKKANEMRPYSPTDTDIIPIEDLPKSFCKEPDSMEISPISSPVPFDKSLMPVDMEIVSSDSSNDPVFFNETNDVKPPKISVNEWDIKPLHETLSVIDAVDPQPINHSTKSSSTINQLTDNTKMNNEIEPHRTVVVKSQHLNHIPAHSINDSKSDQSNDNQQMDDEEENALRALLLAKLNSPKARQKPNPTISQIDTDSNVPTTLPDTSLEADQIRSFLLSSLNRKDNLTKTVQKENREVNLPQIAVNLKDAVKRIKSKYVNKPNHQVTLNSQKRQSLNSNLIVIDLTKNIHKNIAEKEKSELSNCLLEKSETNSSITNDPLVDDKPIEIAPVVKTNETITNSELEKPEILVTAKEPVNTMKENTQKLDETIMNSVENVPESKNVAVESTVKTTSESVQMETKENELISIDNTKQSPENGLKQNINLPKLTENLLKSKNNLSEIDSKLTENTSNVLKNVSKSESIKTISNKKVKSAPLVKSTKPLEPNTTNRSVKIVAVPKTMNSIKMQSSSSSSSSVTYSAIPSSVSVSIKRLQENQLSPITTIKRSKPDPFIGHIKPVKKLIIQLRESETETETDESDNNDNTASVQLLMDIDRVIDNASPSSIVMDSPSYSPSSPIHMIKPNNDEAQNSETSSSGSGGVVKGSSNDFQKKLDEFLKKARSKVEQEIGKTNVIAVPVKQADSTPVTPLAVRHLPPSAQLEYRKLVNRMSILEKQKKLMTTKKHKRVPPISVTIANEMKTIPTNPDLSDIKVTLKSSGRVVQSNSQCKTQDSLIKQVLVKNVSIKAQQEIDIKTESKVIDNFESFVNEFDNKVNQNQTDNKDNKESTLKIEDNKKCIGNLTAKLLSEKSENSITSPSGVSTDNNKMPNEKVEKPTQKTDKLKNEKIAVIQKNTRTRTKSVSNGISKKITIPNLSQMTAEQQSEKLVKAESDYMKHSTTFLNDMDKLNALLRDGQLAKQSQIDTETELEQLRTKMKELEDRLDNKKSIISKLYPTISTSHKRILNSRMKSMQLSSFCDKLGKMINGEKYKIPNVKEQIITKLKDICLETKRLKGITKTPNLQSVQELRDSVFNVNNLTLPTNDNNEIKKLTTVPIATQINNKATVGTSTNSIEYKNMETQWNIDDVATNNDDDDSQTVPIGVVGKYKSPLDYKLNKSLNNPNAILCPFQLMGQCEDKECSYQHLST